MTYSQGSVILASDFNSFAGPTSAGGTAGANLNDIWATGSGDKGWGQTVIANPAISSVVTAPNQWQSLINNLATAGSQTGTTLTSRTVPTSGTVITALPNINTDLTNVTNNRGNAAASGTEYGTFSGTTYQGGALGTGNGTWTITWTHTVTFPSADQARYFWNAGGIVRIKYGKSSTGTDIDADWNALAGYCGTINLTGRVNGASQTIGGQVYTGTTRLGGTGGSQTALATTTGWYQLTSSPTTIFQLNNSSPYTGDYIQTTATATSSTVLTLVTTWYQPALTAYGTTSNISGGTATNSPSTTITGTAPTTLVTYVPPSTSYLSNSWGTPLIAASLTTSAGPSRTPVTVCGTANENGSAVLTAPAGTTFVSIQFASYGTPNGSCGSFSFGGCHASTSLSVCTSYLIGQSGTVSIPASNAVFGDPCSGTAKRLYVQATAY